MNQSRGEISAETAASTNKPLEALQGHETGPNLRGGSLQELSPSSMLLALSNPLTLSNLNEEQVQQQQQQQQPNEYQQQEQSFSEWWNEYWSRQPFPSGYTQSSITLLACLLTTIMFLIVVGNLLVCIAIFTEKSLKPTQNWFIASLAVSDLLLGLVVMPFSLARELMGFWVFGPLWCDIHEAIDVLLTTASINTLCLISLDRYWSITQAVSYLKKRTPKRGAFMIAFVWIFSAAVSLPPLFGWKKQSPTITVANSSLSSTSSRQQKQISTTKAAQQPSGAENHWLGSQSQWQPRPKEQQQQLQQVQTQTRDRRNLNRRVHLLNRQELATPILSRRSLAILDPSNLQDASSSNSANNKPLILFNEPDVQDEEPEPFVFTRQQPFLSTQSPIQTAPNKPQPQISNQDQQNSATESTTEYPSCQLSDDIGYVLYSALGSFYIPCAVMVFTYIKIFLAARSRARRAISKQSRANANNKRQTGRRTIEASTGPGKKLDETAGCAPPKAGHDSGRPESGAADTSMTRMHNQTVAAATASVDATLRQQTEPILKGRIVIVERKKSLAASSLAPTSSMDERSAQVGMDADQQAATNAATYTCSDLIRNEAVSSRSSQQQSHETESSSQVCGGARKVCLLEGQQRNQGDMRQGANEQTCTLTTSGAKQASPSALNGETGNNDSSSMITVMSTSMAELPVTRFSFRNARASSTTKGQQLNGGNESKEDERNRKAAALLRAISQVAAQEDQLLKDVLVVEQEGGAVASIPDIVVERRNTGTATVEQTDVTDDRCANATEQHASLGEQMNNATATNETCFMTIEEDSDMLNEQTGRTVMMIANEPGRLKQAGQVGPLAGKGAQNVMMTMLPPGQAAGATICNNMSCRRQQQQHHHHHQAPTRSGSSYCGSSMTLNDEDDIDDCVDDELLTDDCNGYSVSCGLDQYCSGATVCSHCQECDQPEQQLSNGPNKGQSITESPVRKASGKQLARCASEAEAQSIIGDDNLSLTEYRSNEDSSSIVGHDVLDATEAHSSDRKKSLISGSTSGGRKKSSIGFRLSRLGNSGSLALQGGGLLALASGQQQQQQQSGSGGTRNLKALRQNFFLRLNQLTAKSMVKQNKKSSQQSPTGKSSEYSIVSE